MQGQYRLGVDAGGTFTDFVLAGRDGKIRLFKSASTPQDGTRAIAAGLAQMAEELGRPVEDIVRDCDLCINGTTVALNALIELKGVKVGLLCTAGHEDSIEIRLGHKEEGYRYDADYPPAPQLVPRRLRLPVRERVLADGSVRQPLNEDDVRAAIEVFKREGVQAVAVSFVWAPANPAHEQRALRMVAEAMPDVFVCAGHEVYPQVREYTRTSTTIVNAYLSPVMARYVARIDDYFRGLGARGAVRYFQSNGGLAVGEIMRRRAVNAINSGPASAPQAGLYVAAPFGIDNIITVDMGGTSFDITLARRPDQPEPQHRFPAPPHRRADDPRRDAGRGRRLDRPPERLRHAGSGTAQRRRHARRPATARAARNRPSPTPTWRWATCARMRCWAAPSAWTASAPSPPSGAAWPSR